MEEKQIKTGIDRFLEIVNSRKELRLSDAAKGLNVPEATIELWAEVLRQDGQVEVKYDNFGKMIIVPVKQEKAAEKPAAEPPKPAQKPAPKPKTAAPLKRFRMKTKRKSKLLKKYSEMRREKEAVIVKETFSSRVFKAFGRLFGRKPKSDISGGEQIDEIKKRLERIKKSYAVK